MTSWFDIRIVKFGARKAEASCKAEASFRIGQNPFLNELGVTP